MATDRYLLDVNVLMALAWREHVHHQPAHEWFGAVRRRRFATCPMTEAAFLRLSTNPRVVGAEVLLADAVDVLRRIRALPGHLFLVDDSSLADPAIDLTRATSSGQVTDLHLVNLAARSGMVLVTFDRGIETFLDPDQARRLLLLR